MWGNHRGWCPFNGSRGESQRAIFGWDDSRVDYTFVQARRVIQIGQLEVHCVIEHNLLTLCTSVAKETTTIANGDHYHGSNNVLTSQVYCGEHVTHT